MANETTPQQPDGDHFLNHVLTQAARAQECAEQRNAALARARDASGVGLIRALDELRAWNEWIAGDSPNKPVVEGS